MGLVQVGMDRFYVLKSPQTVKYAFYLTSLDYTI